MLEKILQLKSQSMTISQIAEECGLTIGQVKYRLQKGKSKSEQESHQPNHQLPQKAEPDDNQGWRLASYYGRDIIKAMAQGPTVLFVYWEITWPRMRMVASYLQSDYRQIQKGIRIYDVTDRLFDGHNAHWHRDFKIQEEANGWYVNDLQPDRTYIVDFGLFDQNRFCPILRSESVVTPRNTKAVWGEPLIEPVTQTSVPSWFENFSSYSLYTKSTP